MRSLGDRLDTIKHRLNTTRSGLRRLPFRPVETPCPRRLQIFDSAQYVNGRESLVLFRKWKRKSLYRVRIWLEGEDLTIVSGVRYCFPPKSKVESQHVVRRATNARCSTFVWVEGPLAMEAEVELKDGTIFTATHSLRFNREFDSSVLQFVCVE